MAEPFTLLTARAAPILLDNIDTDMIIPSREMRSTGRTGLADGLFAPWRYLDPDARIENPDFILNQPSHRGASILLGGANFGCGSSREHAVWALSEYGVSVVIAPSFAPIFAGNCVRNGIVPVAISREAITIIASAAAPVTVDLERLIVTLAGCDPWSFAIAPDDRMMLLRGLDAIAMTLEYEADILQFIDRDLAERPWVYTGASE
jgi:3-isopropylmalate/(R)-2-methylmalate dehydratase small subunit